MKCFKSCPRVLKVTSDMTYEGLGEMFEADSADSAPNFFSGVDGGPSGGSSVRRPRSEDPHGASGNCTSC